MNALIIGHSYVRDLENLFCREGASVSVSERINLGLRFVSKPGATFQTFLDNWHSITEACDFEPDILVVILGGNDLKVDVPLTIVKQNCYNLFRRLRETFPNAYLIGSQVESRYLKSGDKYQKFGTPLEEDYKRISVAFNSWLNQKKFKDRLFCMRGSHKLDNVTYYRDSVHLNRLGLIKYSSILRAVLVDTCLSKIKKTN